MKPALSRPFVVAALILATVALTTNAFAQYVWIDGHGVKQYSDMPPPPSVPASHILKQPASTATTPSRPLSDDVSPASSQSTATTPPMTIAEREADFRKRHAEQAEKEKKAKEQARISEENKKNCERARDYQTSLTSGQRIARTDRNGERSFLTDEQRAQELHDVNRVLQKCK